MLQRTSLWTSQTTSWREEQCPPPVSNLAYSTPQTTNPLYHLYLLVNFSSRFNVNYPPTCNYWQIYPPGSMFIIHPPVSSTGRFILQVQCLLTTHLYLLVDLSSRFNVNYPPTCIYWQIYLPGSMFIIHPPVSTGRFILLSSYQGLLILPLLSPSFCHLGTLNLSNKYIYLLWGLTLNTYILGH